jgi:hypothetical protein
MASFAVRRSYIYSVDLVLYSQPRRKTYLVIVSQKLVQEVNSFIADESLVLRGNKAVPGLLLETTKDVVILRVELDLVLVKVIEEIISAKNFGDFYELVRVALSMKERLFAENHGGEHCAQAPHIQAVIILLKVHQQLWPLKVTGGNSYIVLGTGVIEFSQSPVDET